MLWALAVAVLGATLAGCGNSQHMAMEVEQGGKIFVRPKIGDVVQWTGPDGKPFTISFTIPGVTPCKETSNSLTTCTVAKAGIFPYGCSGCADPAVVVGSDTGPFYGVSHKLQAAVRNADGVYLYCDATSHAPKASPDPEIASAGENIQWFATDPKMVNWNVTLQSGTCSQTSINQGQPVCTVQPGAQSQTYSITADTCTGTGSATLTIQ
jgi:plastocyanin